MHNLSCENEFYLHENEKSFPDQRLSTRFDTEARGNSEMAYSPRSKRVKNWVRPQSFLGSFEAEQHDGQQTWRTTGAVPNYDNRFRNATNLHYYRIPKDPNAPDMYSSVRIT